MTLQATVEAIGEIVTPYKVLADCPRNIDPEGPQCKLILRDDLRDGLLDLTVGQRRTGYLIQVSQRRRWSFIALPCGSHVKNPIRRCSP